MPHGHRLAEGEDHPPSLNSSTDIFDYGVVNAVLDVVEHAGAHFAILETLVTPMQPSTMLLQLTLPQGREALDEVHPMLANIYHAHSPPSNLTFG